MEELKKSWAVEKKKISESQRKSAKGDCDATFVLIFKKRIIVIIIILI